MFFPRCRLTSKLLIDPCEVYHTRNFVQRLLLFPNFQSLFCASKRTPETSCRFVPVGFSWSEGTEPLWRSPALCPGCPGRPAHGSSRSSASRAGPCWAGRSPTEAESTSPEEGQEGPALFRHTGHPEGGYVAPANVHINYNSQQL